MKKLILICIAVFLILGLVACAGKTEESINDKQNPEKIAKEAQEMKTESQTVQGVQKFKWPQEAAVLGVPEFKNGKISSLGITDKAIAIGYSGLKMDNIEEYKKSLEKEGFSKGQEYPGGSMWNYVKNGKDEAVDITIAFTSDSGEASVIINPKSKKVKVTDNKEAGSLKWLDNIPKEVPVFNKGIITEAKDNASLMTMVYKDVKQSDLDAYKKTLESGGFEFDKDDSNNNSFQYEKVDQVKMTIVIVSLDYKDGYLTLTVAKS